MGGARALLRDALPLHRDRLTAREIEVIGLVVDGLSNREIGRSLGVQEQTVKNHVARIMDKLKVRNRVELALKAVRDNIA